MKQDNMQLVFLRSLVELRATYLLIFDINSENAIALILITFLMCIANVASFL